MTQPFFSRITTKSNNTIIKNTMSNVIQKPVFSNNSRIYYKPHSLAAGGVGTVRNHRAIGKKT